MSFDKKKIGEKIASLRKDRNLTQEQLAEKIGVTVQHLGTIERGKSNTTLDRLDKIADVLGCSSYDLILNTAPLDIVTENISENDTEIEKMLLEAHEFQRSFVKKILKIKKSKE